jgi:basic membrane protein A
MKKSLFLALICILCISCAEEEVTYLTTVRLVTSVNSVNDNGFNELAWNGIRDFYNEDWETKRGLGNAYDVVPVADVATYASELIRVSETKPSLIVATGFEFAEPIQEVAPEFPNQKYLIVNVDSLKDVPNVMQAVFAEHEGSYLVGIAAAMKAVDDGINNPTFGFIGGVAGSVITKFEVGYIQGVLSVIPDAKFVDYYVNDWGSADLAKATSDEWYSTGVYTIFASAGSAGNGVIEAAKEHRQSGRNVWAIGANTDQFEQGIYAAEDSAVLTSMVKRIDTAVEYGLNTVADNSFQGEIITFDIKNDGVGYSMRNSALSENITERLEAVKISILSGEIIIPSTYAEAKTLQGFPQNLLAID